MAVDDQGTLALRPESSVSTPGIRGRYYMVVGDAVAANNGVLWRDNGTGWDRVAPSGSTADTLANIPAASALPGGLFYATNQDALYRSDGASWTRVGPGRAGDLFLTLNSVAETGRILLQGQAWPGTTGIYADLWTKWGAAYPTTLPDMRGRMPVVLGTHADVNAIGDNDGTAVGARRPKHKHVVNDPGHHHTIGIEQSDGAGSVADQARTGTSDTSTNTTGITVGPQTGSEPVDGPAWFTVNIEAKL
jgi:microcystin-dependent protein